MSSLYHGLRRGSAKACFPGDRSLFHFPIDCRYIYPLYDWRAAVVSPGASLDNFRRYMGHRGAWYFLNSIDLKNLKFFSMICYIAMGWCVITVFAANDSIFSAGLSLILLYAGGIAYTAGAVLYGISKKKDQIHAFYFPFICSGRKHITFFQYPFIYHVNIYKPFHKFFARFSTILAHLSTAFLWITI